MKLQFGGLDGSTVTAHPGAPATAINAWRRAREKGDIMTIYHGYTWDRKPYEAEAVEAARRLADLVGKEAYTAWYMAQFPEGHGNYELLLDAARAEHDRLTICTCNERSGIACPACVFATEKQLVAGDGFPY